MMEKTGSKFLLGEPLGDYFEERVLEWEGPFLDSSSARFLAKVASRVFSSFEDFFGKKIFIERINEPLDSVSPRFRKLGKNLAEKNILEKINFPEPAPGWPKLSALVLKMRNGMDSSGYGIEKETAETKAFAELIERHALTEWDKKKFIFGTWEENRSRGALDPGFFKAFSESQLKRDGYKQCRASGDSEFTWRECRSLLEGTKHYIPAAFTCFGYERLEREPELRKATSNGVAAGTSRDMAIHNAICEAIERDAFMIHWLNKISPPKIIIEKAEGNRLRKILELYQKYKIGINLFDITTDLAIPTALAVIRETGSEGPIMYLTMRSDVDFEKAAETALFDALRAGYWKKTEEDYEIKKPEDIRTVRDRHDYWRRQNKEAVDFLFGGQTKKIGLRPLSEKCDFKQKLALLKKRLIDSNLDAYITDLTTDLARENGLFVVASTIPELYPLYLDENYKYLGIRRLYEAPLKMGIFTQPKKEEEMNKVPHPFL